jgi:phytoene dehydrogenase-like protein
MSAKQSQYDVIVIGGGLAGLAAANLLARRGKQVMLVERSRSLGGRAQTKEMNGFYLNLGPHALYRAGAGIRVLCELGVEPRGAVPSTSGASAIKDGKRYTFPAGVVSLLMTGLFDLSAKFQAARWLSAIAKVDPHKMTNLTVSEWVESNLSHPEVRSLVHALFRVATYVNAPDLLSAGVAIAQLQKALSKSVLYLDGGWQTLVDALTAGAHRSGVVMMTEARAKLVERDRAGAVRAVHVEGDQVHETPNVVIAGGPEMIEVVQDAEQTSLSPAVERCRPIKAATLDLCLTRLSEPRATFALGIDRPLYFSVHSAAAKLAPEGAAMIHVAKYLAPGDDTPASETRVELERTLDLIQPGWREYVSEKRFLAAITVMSAIPEARFGGFAGRPSAEVLDVPGLFIAGDWVGKEGLLADASLASAKNAAERICDRAEQHFVVRSA